ncbi:MAG TPA: DUF2124 domain-containing protein [Methanocella sp.]|nr:DUF2124 domain-containing protein [Methanocella sp.]
MYKVVETAKGLSPLLKVFKTQMAAMGVQPANKIVFMGSVGTCVPFIELFAYTLRNDRVEMLLVPDAILEDTRFIWHVPGIGMQVGGAADPKGADFVVILGGLSMPGSKVDANGVAERVKAILKPGGKVMGICFMGMFEKAGWYGKVPFDVVMDATIDPIQVQKFGP